MIKKILKYKKKIFIFNSLTQKKENFIPIINNNINMYICGPTLNNNIHLGNYRTFIFFDVIYRYFKHLKFNVKYIRNITDISNLKKLKNKHPLEDMQKFLLNFYFNFKKFNILSPNIEPRTTSHIIEQIENIKKIIKKKYAYIKNGSIYFDILNYTKKIGNYGNILNNININNVKLINNNFLNDKKNYYDFAIWKKANNNTMKWNSPWGIGYPGWHLGCSTMSNKYLGNYFDIHGGGLDLKFPHHECEISQCNVINNNKYNLAKFWIHTNMLIINNKKMSKSLNNYIIPDDIINGKLNFLNYKKINPIIIKLYFLKTHYRKVINFTKKSLIEVKNDYKYLLSFFKKIKKVTPKKKSSINYEKICNNCYEYINDDFNIPLLIYNLFKINKLIEKCIINELQITLEDLNKINFFMKTFIIKILGLKKVKKKLNYNKLFKKIFKIRNDMRKKKIYFFSDKLRKILNKFFIIKDNKI
ncbi:MAG: cysteine--tRNA ligase [Candidatus Shikimatogenerans bostrichidophilus]|nr:MAG: cysteine--tRNA ligase [Candidatus Shikimatogenerans bostrichidophilus]